MNNNFHILYAEDDLEILNELTEILSMKYSKVTSAKNGQIALEEFYKDVPDVLITDIQMPIVDGLMLISKIKKTHPKIPVIITSAFNDSEYLIKAIELGVNHYITKPIIPEKLFELIDLIKETRDAQKEIEERNELIKNIISLVPNPIFSVKNEKIDFANRAFLDILGVDDISELKNNPLFELNFCCLLDTSLKFSSINEWAIYFNKNASDYRLISLNTKKSGYRVYKVDLVDGFLERIVFLLTDVTELENTRRVLELEKETSLKELEKHKKMLEVQSRMAQIGDMINIISHQWKQPLSVLSMASLMLKDYLIDKYGSLDEQIIDSFNIMQKNIEYMSSTINDFKNFFSPTKLVKSFTLNEIIDSVLTISGALYLKNGVSIKRSGDLDLMLKGYPNELKQVIMNIFNNSVDALVEKNIEESNIYFRAKYVPQKEMMEIEIEDEAGGIPDGIIDHIFEPFFTTKGERGTGIGLAIVKQVIVDSMGGKVWAKNSSKGAIFHIEIPTNLE